MKISITEFKDGLKQFYGTEMYHKLNYYNVYATDGVAWFCENAECYWLFDEMCEWCFKHKDETFIVVIVNVIPTDDMNLAMIKVEDGDCKRLDELKIPTDMPVGGWKFFISNYPEQKVIMLPSEY